MGPSAQMPTGALFVSSVTGEPIASHEVGPFYWQSNLENRALFSDALQRLGETDKYHLIELGPHSALELPVKQSCTKLGISEDDMPYSVAIIRSKDSVESILGLARKQCRFEKINELSMNKGSLTKYNYKVLYNLPTYRWSYEDSPL